MVRNALRGAQGIFEDTPGNRRKLALILYALVAPAIIAVTYLFADTASGRLNASLAVLGITLTASLWIMIRREPKVVDWIVIAAVVPIVCFGIARAACGSSGAGLMLAISVPVACAGVVLEMPVVVAAVITAVLTCFVIVLEQRGIGAAIGNSLVAAFTQGAIAWVTFGVSSNHRVLQRALRQSKEKFSKVFEHNGDAIFISEIETGKFVEINKGFEQLTGYSRHEAIGKTSHELGLWVDVQDRQRFFEMIKVKGSVRSHQVRFRSSPRVSFGEPCLRRWHRSMVVFSESTVPLPGCWDTRRTSSWAGRTTI